MKLLLALCFLGFVATNANAEKAPGTKRTEVTLGHAVAEGFALIETPQGKSHVLTIERLVAGERYEPVVILNGLAFKKLQSEIIHIFEREKKKQRPMPCSEPFVLVHPNALGNSEKQAICFSVMAPGDQKLVFDWMEQVKRLIASMR